MIVKTESADVFRTSRRRFFTKRAAYKDAARAKIKSRYDDGWNCDYHNLDTYHRILNKLSYIYEQSDNKEQEVLNNDH